MVKEELIALDKMKEKFTNDYNELYDALYYYMLTYSENDKMSNYLFIDEIENLIGLRDHDKIINYILKL